MDFRSPCRRRPEGDEGAALVVALIFIMVVGVMVTAALSKSGAVLQTDERVLHRS